MRVRWVTIFGSATRRARTMGTDRSGAGRVPRITVGDVGGWPHRSEDRGPRTKSAVHTVIGSTPGVTTMKYKNLGASGVKVSTLCLGGMTFGEADEKSFMHKAGSDEATSHAVIDRAVAAGVNFIDTADVYGPDGLSERVLGNWLVSR